jgi:predicted RNA methylase
VKRHHLYQNDQHRRKTGVFPTPDRFITEAHSMLSAKFGDDWKEKYVVWDCCCGTGNLTKLRHFKSLYLSTLEEADLDAVPQHNAFQYDFLSELTFGEKVPVPLVRAFEQKRPILFLINPPYGKSADESTKGAGKTHINQQMLSEKMWLCSAQLYAQFLYRIAKLKQQYDCPIAIGLFSKPCFITALSFIKFRKLWYDHFNWLDGMLFRANHFEDVKGTWGILFSLWETGRCVDREFNVSLKDVDASGNLVTIGNKLLYNADDNSATEWARQETKGKKLIDVPQITSYATIKESRRGRLVEGALGHMNVGGNNVAENSQSVGLFSSYSGRGNGGISIIEDNFLKCMALFCARKVVSGHWINDKDEYLAPKMDDDYIQWANDAVIYGLFNQSSQQSSLRHVPYQGLSWTIRNQFFFMGNEIMKSLATANDFIEMSEDAELYPQEAFVWKFLQKTPISDDASELLVEAEHLISKSIQTRREYFHTYPKLCLQSWSAGWAQLKPMLKDHFANDLKAFGLLYKEFEKRMLAGVYKFRFLRERP